MAALTPEQLQRLLERAGDMNREAKRVERNARVLKQQSARLLEELAPLQTEEVTRKDEHSHSREAQ